MLSAFTIADGAIYLRVADLKTGRARRWPSAACARVLAATLLHAGRFTVARWPEQLRLGAGAVRFWTRDGSPEADEWRIEEAGAKRNRATLEWLAQLKELTVRRPRAPPRFGLRVHGCKVPSFVRALFSSRRFAARHPARR